MSFPVDPSLYPAGYDPFNGNALPTNSGPGAQMALIMGLAGLAAFCGIGIGAFFSEEAAAAAEAAPLETVQVTFTVEFDGEVITGVQTWCTNGVEMTEGQEIVLATLSDQGVGGVAPTVVAEILESWGFSKVLDAGALLVLADYDTNVVNPGRYPDFGHYIGDNVPGGGPGAIGGWPGFLGTDPSHPGASQKVCVIVGEDNYCYWVY